jgi:hypothetical protein
MRVVEPEFVQHIGREGVSFGDDGVAGEDIDIVGVREQIAEIQEALVVEVISEIAPGKSVFGAKLLVNTHQALIVRLDGGLAVEDDAINSFGRDRKEGHQLDRCKIKRAGINQVPIVGRFGDRVDNLSHFAERIRRVRGAQFRGKVSRQIGGSRKVGLVSTYIVTKRSVLVPEKEKGLVVSVIEVRDAERAAEGAAELIALQGIDTNGGEPVGCVENTVANELECAAVILVRS